MAGRTTPWKRIRPNPLCQDGSSVLAVRPETHEVLLIEVWPRCALDSVALGHTLKRHLRRHERWRTVLSGRPSRCEMEIVGTPAWIPDRVRDDRMLSFQA